MSVESRDLFDRLAPALLRYLRRLMGSPTDAEEILQEAFLKLHVQLSAGSDIANVRAWLFRVGTNAARDLEREPAVRARHDAVGPSANVVDIEARVHRQRATRRALHRLPRRMR